MDDLLKFTLQIKSAWWWRPAVKVVLIAAKCRIISLKTMERAVNAILQRAFKWRVDGLSDWKHLDLSISLERQ